MGEKSHSKFESILYIFVIPILFTLVLSGVLLSYLGYPVLTTLESWGNKIPVVKNLVPGTDPKENADNKNGNQPAQPTTVQLKEKDQKVQELTQQQDANQKQLEDLKKQNEELQKQLVEKKKQQDQEELQQAASLYADMSGSKAAGILETLPLDEAAYTISALDEEQQSSILGSFKDPKKAANITMLMKEITQGSDRQTVQQQARKLESPASTLTDTLSAMPPAQSASIIQNMMTISPKEAMDVMKNMNTTSRSQVLAEITKSNARLAATITANLNN